MENPRLTKIEQDVVDHFFDGHTPSQCARHFGIAKSDATYIIESWPGWRYMWGSLVEHYE